MMKLMLGRAVLIFAALIPAAHAGILYDNTAFDTFLSVSYNGGSYSGIGDQIHLVSAGNAATALLQFYNESDAGSFGVELRFYDVGAPVGAQIGGVYSVGGIATAGGDVIDVQIPLAGLALPQDVIFVATITGVSAGVNLWINLFEPPGAGSSDNSYLIVQGDSGFDTAGTIDANVYFQLSDAPAPEPGTCWMLGLGAGLLALRRLMA